MDQEQNFCFDGLAPGTNNFGTKTASVNFPTVEQVPIEYYTEEMKYMSDLSEYLDSPNVADHSKLKRKASEVARDPERRKLIDKAYRLRCKEKKMRTEGMLGVLTEENDKVKRENSQLKKEQFRLEGIVQTQNESMKQLQREFGQLKGQLDGQNTVAEVLSKQLASCKDVNLQRENKQLRLERDFLMKKIGNRENMNMIQLEAKNTKLEQEKSALQVIVDALCAKINRDNKHDPE